MWKKHRNQSKADLSAVCWWRCSVKLLTIKNLWYAVCFTTLWLFSIWKFFKLFLKVHLKSPYRISGKFALNSIQTQGKHTVPRGRMFQKYPTFLWYCYCIPESIFIAHHLPYLFSHDGLTLMWPRSCFIEMLINISYWMSAFVIAFYILCYGNYDCTKILSWTETILYIEGIKTFVKRQKIFY